MINFEKSNDSLFLIYTPYNSINWLYSQLKNDHEIPIKDTFFFNKHDLHSPTLLEYEESRRASDDEDNLIFNPNKETVTFLLGKLTDTYYKIESRIFRIKIDFYVHKDVPLSDRMFFAPKKTSLPRKIAAVLTEDFCLGGSRSNSIPLEEFEILVKNFPNDYELKKYTESRVGVALRDYFEKVIDAPAKYEKYMNKKASTKGVKLIDEFRDFEAYKYRTILGKLREMLAKEDEYIERQWQREILEIIQLIFPKYIRVFEEAPIRDALSDTMRSLDFLLIDSNGHVDIAEIKRPKGESIISRNLYRDNHIPMRELSGTVMQIEKYIYHLNHWGKTGEKYLTEKYRNHLPPNLQLKIVNPGGLIIMGRQSGLSDDQIGDLEVVKRKYKNVLDILTYDDLIARIGFMINLFEAPEK